MGYYTNFTLTASVCTVGSGSYTTNGIPEITLKSLEEEIDKMEVFEGGSIEEYGCYSYTKWYDWEEDMSLLSKRFPEILFHLHGDGEESDDLWDAYFFEGKCQHCPAKIIYDDFDPIKLQKTIDDDYDTYSYQS